MRRGGDGVELDLRLAIAAAAAWAVLGAEHRTGPTVIATTAALAATVAVVAVCGGRSRRFGRLAAVVGLAGFCVAGVAGSYAVRLSAADRSPVRRLAADGVSVRVELTVTADPRPLAGAGPGRVVVEARLGRMIVSGIGHTYPGAVVVFAPAAGWSALVPGQVVWADGRLAPARPHELSVAALSVRGAPELSRGPPWWQRLAAAVRAGLRRAAAGLPSEVAGLLPGLVDGDTSGLDPVIAHDFQLAGLTHLVAVSGTNCMIVVAAGVLVLRRLRAPPWLTATGAGLALLGFVVVARPAPSVVRAAVMAGIALLALLSGRPRNGIPLVAAATLAGLVWHPDWAMDPGFAMSVLATVALIVLAPGWAEGLRRRHVPPVAAEALAVAAAAHVVTAPVIALISGQVSLVAVPANVLAEFAVAPATVLGFLAALTSVPCLPVARALAWLAQWPVRWLIGVADGAAHLPGATMSWPRTATGAVLLAALGLGLITTVRTRSLRVPLVVALLVGLLVQVPVRRILTHWPPRGWLFVACDIGQGDALVLPAGPGAAVVVDTGPDPVSVDRCLRDLHVHTIPLLVLSHLHLDHVGGLAGALRHRTVGAVLTGPLPEPASGLALVRRVLGPRGLVARVGTPGPLAPIGAVHLEMLAPPVALRGTRSDPNNSSLVLRATVAGRTVLLPGDVELEAQRAMLDERVDVRADVLKVPHHGSAYSDPAFLAATRARVAVISVGVDNDYGHPAPALLARLAELGIPTYRTDRDGALAVFPLGPAGRAGSGLAVARRAHRRVPAASAHPRARADSGAVRTVAAGPAAVSPRPARMVTCPPPSLLPCGVAVPARPWSCSPVTRSTSSPAPSSRSPPRCAPRSRAPSSPNGSAAS